MTARHQYSGTVFSDMGNHECTGATDGNCAGSSGNSSNNLKTYLANLVQPLGRTLPYYTVHFSDTGGTWTAKLIILACNDWDATQKTWFAGELAQHTTYTFVSRHEPPGVTAPCVSEADQLLASATYDLLIVGHTHTYSHSGKRLTEGTGGAPITGSVNYGYATVEQLATGGFKVTQYDYMTNASVDSYTVP
jgi:hypothetical protein